MSSAIPRDEASHFLAGVAAAGVENEACRADRSGGSQECSLSSEAAASLTVYCSDAARFGCGRPSEPTWTRAFRILADQQSLLTLIAHAYTLGAVAFTRNRAVDASDRSVKRPALPKPCGGMLP